MKRWPEDEVALGRSVTTFLQKEGWKVYPEVALAHMTGAFDIVAERKPVLMVVELKCTFGFTVVDQAIRARSYANCVCVAVPKRRDRRPRPAALSLLRHERIGLIEASGLDYCVLTAHPPLLRRPPLVQRLKDALSEPLQSTVEAGTNRGGYMTPFRRTITRVREYVENHDGCYLREAISNVEHHYQHDASARGALSSIIRDGLLDGVTIRYDGRKPRLFATERETHN